MKLCPDCHILFTSKEKYVYAGVLLHDAEKNGTKSAVAGQNRQGATHICQHDQDVNEGADTVASGHC